jgi:signal transduction histidine kinase
MAPEKLRKLNEIYQKYIEMAMFDFPVDDSREFFAEKIMGYGTNLDEKVFSFSEFRELVLRQRHQAIGIEMHINRSPVFQRITNDENATIIVEELFVTMIISGMEHNAQFRLTTFLEHVHGNWVVIHFHASAPIVAEATDVWNLDELNRKNKELQKLVDERTAELRISLEELKATQAQLIQSEKMASLGELTAGIAHEIQNPLNFVNNFSEVNKELIEELKSEKRKVKSERDENLEEELIENIRENEEKINHHGKRADAIVKSMLQHSQTSSGKKEPTDINALADEYFRLAFHGLKAKDKEFNSKMESNYDPTIGNINIVLQEIGRVLLNLINNAFYAVNEKKKLNGETYDPVVSIRTKKNGDRVLISVKDNGNGIPDKVVDKIFQPFFTTKPTGQGTGLGLSLAYDIVKAHGGELKVGTKEGEGSEFIIQLPNHSSQ